MLYTLLSHVGSAPVSCIHTFLGLQPWYAYLPSGPNGDFDSNCNIIKFTLLGSNSDIVLVVLAIIDDLLIVAGLLAVAFVIYGAIKYITSQGSPDGTSKALSTIINALVGLGISLIAVQAVAFIGNKLAGSAGTGSSNGGGGVDLSVLPDLTGSASGGGIIQTVLSVVFNLIGALAFLFIILGGLAFVTANGDPQKVARAKATVLYAIIGLVVAIVAQSIVSLIASKL